ncbi:acyl-CoA dehydrogenase NM domain-like protein [Athelia psychrophila]|uniref:Acyl-CoA dehydrogenase NM domain-like protein n=1 Tax=Athelia psychrophila TaxID=1759441 RepID=A0A167WBV8_9AGAM|nr:acyl-CoA dehydrogenase NM domain-like protein [Fibularhizoctonia sp. CBS 109695]
MQQIRALSNCDSSVQQTRALSQTWLFQQHSEGLPLTSRVWLSYQRAQAVARTYALTAEDVLHMSAKFWQLHRDHIGMPMDGAVAVLLTIQYNLCAGTLAMFSARPPAVEAILQEVLNFDVSGQYLLTEIGHGLDARNLETTATVLSQGGYELHTPHAQAAKYMPPTAPMGGRMGCVAVVFARLIDIDGNDRGIKSFIVRIHNGQDMTAGVTCKLLPPRGGSRPINHSLTYFDRVRLPKTALLGTPERALDEHAEFFKSIQRVIVGGLTMAAVTLPALRTSSYIAARYSLRRKTIDPSGREIPIITFQTQKIPILTAVAQSFVMDRFLDWGIARFGDRRIDHRVRHAISSITKTIMVFTTQDSQYNIADRCGAQGLFEVNQITATFNDLRGAMIAEGDLLVVAIRLATELLLERYAVPPPADPSSLLAQHERGLFTELQKQLKTMRSHRSPEFDKQNLPMCLPLVMAIGQRMAYESAVAAHVDHALLDLYEVSCIKSDVAWYTENGVLTRLAIREREMRAVGAVFPRLEEFLAEMDVDAYITAPIISDDKWKLYVAELQTFSSPAPRPDFVLSAPAVLLSGKL